MGSLGGRREAVFEEEGVKFMFRRCGLVPSLDVHRGVILPVELSNGRVSMSFFGRVMRVLKLGSGLRHLPSALSNKRRRQISVTQTLLAGPTVILTSRPAKGLSSIADVRIMKLLGSYTTEFRRAALVIARRRRMTRVTSEMVHVSSKGVCAESYGSY